MNRQLRRGGGIMNVEPRQKYGLGSFVRKITKPISKIADKIIPNEIPKLVNKIPAPIRAALLFTPAAPYVAAANAATALSRSQGRGLSLGDVANLGINYAAYGQSGGFGGQGRYQVPGFSTDGTFTGFGKQAVVPGQEGFDSTDFLEGNSPPPSSTGNIEFDTSFDPSFESELRLEQGGGYSTSGGMGDPAQFGLEGSVSGGSGGSSGSGAQVVKTATKDIGNIDRLTNVFKEAGGGFSGSKAVFTDVAKDVLGFEEFATFGKNLDMKSAVAIFTKNPTLFIGVPTAMAYLTAPKQPEESEFDFNERKEIVNSYLKRYYSQANPTKTAAEVASFVSDNTREYSAKGGLMGLRKRAMKGGMMMPMGTPRVNEGGVTELDYRAEGGFVPVGIKEKADDVPAMLSKNEFVMTADAVRAAGNGSIEKGAQKMYDTMKQLESRVV